MDTRRADIEGLRALAVLLVLGYHARLPFLRGGFVGVDVFFVVSGFLITGLILREVAATGGLHLGRFYARRARRLLPATALVFVVTAALTLLVLPATRWRTIGGDIAAAAGYVVNWRLAEQSVDYLAQGAAASPVQHFWSLSVEEQFYLVWPLLLVALVVLARRRTGRVPTTRALLVGLTVIAVPSFAWSVRLSVVDPGPGYFVTTTRLWELALGGLLAVLAGRAEQLPPRWRTVAAWTGLVAVVVSALVITDSTPFPGYAALGPTVGTALVLAAGTGGRAAGTGFLRTRAMTGIGAMSYSLYLWHWPLLVVAGVVLANGGALPPAVGLAVAAASALPAWLSYRFVEAPVHHSARLGARPALAGLVGLACVGVGLLAAWGVQSRFDDRYQAAVVALRTHADAPGAAALGDDPAGSAWAAPRDRVDVLVPDPVLAVRDIARLDGHACIASLRTQAPGSCTYGPADAQVRVAVVGDSKMQQWLPALQQIADERGWRLDTYLMSACPLADVPIRASGGGTFDLCMAYNEHRLDAVAAPGRYDVVLTAQRAVLAWTGRDDEAEARALMRDSLVRTWARITAGGARVVVVANNADPPANLLECVQRHRNTLSACAFADGSDGQTQLAAAAIAGAQVVDLRAWVCPAGTCAPVIGDVLVYRQGSHLTTAYVRTLEPQLARALVPAVEGG